MALLKSIKEIESLIPKPVENEGDGIFAYTPQEELLKNRVYAIEVDNKEKKIKGIYRVSFSVFSSKKNSYLFINNYDKGTSSTSPFVKSKFKKEITPEDWGFKVNKMGLYLKTGTFQSTTVYFSTSILDANEIRKDLNEKIKKMTVITETVYV